MNVPAIAQQWRDAGFSTIPILPDGKKRPAIKWAPYIEELPSLEEVSTWWREGSGYGIALAMGPVSMNAEMLELEARACDGESLDKIRAACYDLGVDDLWNDLCQVGYTEASPTGGLHLIYRVSGHPVPGNEKVARRPATTEELLEHPDDKVKVLAETRGHGGYVIVAPTPGTCHPSGEGWIKTSGLYGTVLTITWEQRVQLHAAIAAALDQLPPTRLPVPVPAPEAHTLNHFGNDGGRPGDDFESVPWDDALLLGGAGWHRGLTSATGETVWTRPGKDPRDGFSATTGRDPNRDRLYVFSTATVLPDNEPLTKFHVYALLHHGGDHGAAAKSLRQRGFGDVATRSGELQDFTGRASIDEESFTLDAIGAASRLADHVAGNFLWAYEEKCYYHWTGTHWTPDDTGELPRQWDKLTWGLIQDGDAGVKKWAETKARTAQMTNFAISHMRTVEGVTVSRREFDNDRGILNVHNGTLDLRSNRFRDHSRSDKITRMFNASFDPTVEAPHWIKFMETVLPDPNIRDYVKRACGYSLLGDADQRALFLVWGPSGTGKSQFLETLRHVFADYGATASLSTFIPSQGKGPSPDVHKLRGRRFVSTSETADGVRFDEEMIKRLTGRDVMSTRSLYQMEQEWTPECSIWIATNHKPRFASDDNAIWRRSKLLPFLTEFGEGGQQEIPDYARRFLFAESTGILNWMLEGLHGYLANGLMEPIEVREQVAIHRREVDMVAMFLDEMIEDGRLTLGEEYTVVSRSLYQLYLDWSHRGYEKPFARRRFTERVLRYDPVIKRSHSKNDRTIRGLGIGGTIMGQWMIEN